MIDEAFGLLRAIEYGAAVSEETRLRWLDALRAISWVKEEGGSLVLTEAGQRALRFSVLSSPGRRAVSQAIRAAASSLGDPSIGYSAETTKS